jgi:hypothetical protein
MDLLDDLMHCRLLLKDNPVTTRHCRTPACGLAAPLQHIPMSIPVVYAQDHSRHAANL